MRSARARQRAVRRRHFPREFAASMSSPSLAAAARILSPGRQAFEQGTRGTGTATAGAGTGHVAASSSARAPSSSPLRPTTPSTATPSAVHSLRHSAARVHNATALSDESLSHISISTISSVSDDSIRESGPAGSSWDVTTERASFSASTVAAVTTSTSVSPPPPAAQGKPTRAKHQRPAETMPEVALPRPGAVKVRRVHVRG